MEFMIFIDFIHFNSYIRIDIEIFSDQMIFFQQFARKFENECKVSWFAKASNVWTVWLPIGKYDTLSEIRKRKSEFVRRAAEVKWRSIRGNIANAFWTPPTNAPPTKRLLYYQCACGVSSEHGLLHRSGHSALKPVPFVKPIFRDFATSLGRSGLALWACAV